MAVSTIVVMVAAMAAAMAAEADETETETGNHRQRQSDGARGTSQTFRRSAAVTPRGVFTKGSRTDLPSPCESLFPLALCSYLLTVIRTSIETNRGHALECIGRGVSPGTAARRNSELAERATEHHSQVNNLRYRAPRATNLRYATGVLCCRRNCAGGRQTRAARG